MANVRLATASRNAMLHGLADLLDGGLIEIYSGTQPANANGSPGAGTKLATLQLPSPVETSIANGVLTMDSITEDSSADADGTAAWARIRGGDTNNETVFDCDVGTSGATINLNTTSIVTGGPVRITAFTLTMPSGE